MTTTRQRCFVIMPFSETSKEHTTRYWTKHFKSFLKPLIEEHPALEACRSQPLRGDIVNQIIKDLVVSRVVVADLTDSNANVYWELGVRQSFMHGTITIAEADTPLPSDIGAKGTLFYHPKDHLKDADFRRDFNKAIQDCLDSPHSPDSRVLEAISGRGTLFQVFQRDETIRQLDAVLSECESNLTLFGIYIENAHNNQELRQGKQDGKAAGEWRFPGNLLRAMALELLIAHRYIDEDLEFYNTAEEAHDSITEMNRQLILWSQYSDAIEKWVLKHKEFALNILNRLNESVLNARERISNVL